MTHMAFTKETNAIFIRLALGKAFCKRLREQIEQLFAVPAFEVLAELLHLRIDLHYRLPIVNRGMQYRHSAEEQAHVFCVLAVQAVISADRYEYLKIVEHGHVCYIYRHVRVKIHVSEKVVKRLD